MRAMTALCRRDRHAGCDGVNLAATGWNWWCTCHCHPEPTITDEAHRPALEFWRKHRDEVEAR